MNEKKIHTEKPAETPEEKQRRENAETRERLKKQAEEERKKVKEALEAMREGKGRLGLKNPILAGEKEITELTYDFTELTGLDYTEAMDAGAGMGGRNLPGMGYRQGLSLFAKAASKCTEGLDMNDIVSRISAADAAEGVELASLFFSESIQAGRKRISKK